MKRHPIHQFFAIIILLTYISFSLSLFASEHINADETIQSSYHSLITLQLQLKELSKTTYINAVNNTPNSDIKNQLNILSSTVDQTKKDIMKTLTDTKSITPAHSIQLHALLSINSYLQMLVVQINNLLIETVPSDLYDIYMIIFFLNSLIDQNILYFGQHL